VTKAIKSEPPLYTRKYLDEPFLGIPCKNNYNGWHHNTNECCQLSKKVSENEEVIRLEEKCD
jgi:hypothetical protein